MSDCADWKYTPELGEARKKNLTAETFFETVVRRVRDAVTGQTIKFSIDKGYVEPVTDCLRPSFLFKVDAGTGDLFFNGAAGYRAQYYRSPSEGEKGNRLLIDIMRELLLAAAEAAGLDCHANAEPLTMPRADVERALSLPSAKVWPFEDQQLNPEFHKIMTTDCALREEILAPRWLDFARKEIKKANRGVRAPKTIQVLEIRGAFINARGEERIAPNKVGRSCEIHMFGST